MIQPELIILLLKNLQNDSKKIDIIIKYLIYYNLKEIWLELLDMDDDLIIIHNELKAIKEKLASIDETLFNISFLVICS